MAQFKPADHSKGDANTIGGYQAVHDRPAAFDGPDGFSYSVALVAEPTGEPARPWAAFILFVRWARIGAQTPEGHLETDYLAHGETERDALDAIGATPLSEVKRQLDELVVNSQRARGAPADNASASGSPPARRWWDAVHDSHAEDDA